MTLNDVLKKLKSRANPANVAGMARFGIRPQAKVLGVPMPALRTLAKQPVKSAKWIAADALRELTSVKITKMIKRRNLNK